MPEFLQLIWDICCLRRGPQDLPYAPLLLLWLCAIWLGLDLLIEHDWATLLTGVFVLGAYLAALRTILRMRDLVNRFVQTATALVGCGLVFDSLMLPMRLIYGDAKSIQPTPLNGLLGSVVLATLVWRVIVDATIFRHSLNVTFAVGLCIALGWFIFLAYLSHLLLSSGAAV